MTIFILLILILLFFTLSTFFGSPYLPSLSKKAEAALDLLNLRPNDTLLELGCGDGRVMLAAAKRGWRVVGYEINPIFYAISWLRTRQYRDRVKIIYGDMFLKTWPEADGIYCFLIPHIMPRVHKKVLSSELGPVKLLSFASPIPNKPISEQNGNLFLYRYD